MLILVIDDDRNIRDVAAMSLRRIGGHEVLLAADGQEGIELARRRPVELIVLDAMMPGLDGAGTLELLRSDPALARVPVIVMTARTRTEDHAHLLSLGAMGLIVKPFDPMTLPAEIQQILEH